MALVTNEIDAAEQIKDWPIEEKIKFSFSKLQFHGKQTVAWAIETGRLLSEAKRIHGLERTWGKWVMDHCNISLSKSGLLIRLWAASQLDDSIINSRNITQAYKATGIIGAYSDTRTLPHRQPEAFYSMLQKTIDCYPEERLEEIRDQEETCLATLKLIKESLVKLKKMENRLIEWVGDIDLT